MLDDNIPEDRDIPGVDTLETPAHNAVGFVLSLVALIVLVMMTIVLLAAHNLFWIVTLVFAILFAINASVRWPWSDENRPHETDSS